MLTKLTIRNFKTFRKVEIELGQNVVFVGPNNSGKTTALQALALWYAGLQRWRESKSFGLEIGRVGMVEFLNRLDLTAIPVPDTQFLWHRLNLIKTRNIVITIEGVTNNNEWSQTLRFVFENPESIYCALPGATPDGWSMVITPSIVFLPPMSGLVATEPRIEKGRINVLVGEGRTAEVLRNLCYQLYEENGTSRHWDKLVGQIKTMFGVEILAPNYLPARGEIRMTYRDRNGTTLDLSSSGRGMLQVLLLLAYMYNNPGAVLLLDEPDAHLEIIRQREIYDLLTRTAREQGSQIIAATHSEVILETSAELDTAIAFLGKPHRIDKGNISQVKKSLKEIKAVDYYLAEQTGWVLYLEGSTDLAILQAFARQLQHPAENALSRSFFHDLEGNEPENAKNHFEGLLEAKPDLLGIGLFDRIGKNRLHSKQALRLLAWQRYEIENYFCTPDVLLAFSRLGVEGDEVERREKAMQDTLDEINKAYQTLGQPDLWSSDRKASEALEAILKNYFTRLNLYNTMSKGGFHILVDLIPADKIDPEITEKLDAIVAVAQKAKPRVD